MSIRFSIINQMGRNGNFGLFWWNPWQPLAVPEVLAKPIEKHWCRCMEIVRWRIDKMFSIASKNSCMCQRATARTRTSATPSIRQRQSFRIWCWTGCYTNKKKSHKRSLRLRGHTAQTTRLVAMQLTSTTEVIQMGFKPNCFGILTWEYRVRCQSPTNANWYHVCCNELILRRLEQTGSNRNCVFCLLWSLYCSCSFRWG